MIPLIITAPLNASNITANSSASTNTSTCSSDSIDPRSIAVISLGSITALAVVLAAGIGFWIICPSWMRKRQQGIWQKAHAAPQTNNPLPATPRVTFNDNIEIIDI